MTTASKRPAAPIRFAVVGCGVLARSQHIPNIASSPRARLQVVCDVSDESLRACEPFKPARQTGDFVEAIAADDVDAVCLAATEKLRWPVIEAALSRGKPVYVEKPLARSLEEMYQIQKLVRASGVPFCVGHNRRAAPAVIEAQRIFRTHMTSPRPNPWRWEREGAARPRMPDEGVAGMSVRINDDCWSWKNWVYDKTQAPHGPMLFEMTHFTDMCNFFLAAEPLEVVAMETGMFNHAIIIRYKTGELATISMCANGTFGYPKELYEVMGKGGVVVLDHLLEVRTAGLTDVPHRITFPMIKDRHPNIGAELGLTGWLAKKRAAADEAVASGDLMKQFAAEPDRGHAHMIERFIDQILGGPEVCGVDSAVMATRIAFAAIKSAHERRVVRVEEV